MAPRLRRVFGGAAVSNGTIGVAISTTGDEHRLGFLETAVAAWREHLLLGSVIVVTVDGSEDDTERVREVVDRAGPKGHIGGTTWRVGQVGPGIPSRFPMYRDGRMGVAVNKNTGIELLMEAGVSDLFLCDDDTWPIFPTAISKHVEMNEPHSMVCWGASRLTSAGPHYASWSWPRGSLLYVERSVISEVGGMIEAFGPGGHEHVEWSRRIYQAGLTPAPFISPRVYAETSPLGRGTRASMFWHCEDMRRRGETVGDHRLRRKRLTSVRRRPEDWEHIETIMAEKDGDTSFVPFMAHENGRASATLCSTSTGQGAGGEK